MKIQLTRRMKAGSSVIGELQWGAFSCRTLENAEFIIPLGEYEIKTTFSPRFKKNLPLLSVPHRKGIRIHTGNFASDSRGCILVGEEVTSFGAEFRLIDSRGAMARLLHEVQPLWEFYSPAGSIVVCNEKGFTLNYFDEVLI